MRALVRHPGTWIGAGIAFALVLRAPWLHAAFGRDEGGVAYIALHWTHSGPFPYGSYFLDRPPLLVAQYRLAELLGGALGIRVLGALAAAATVAITTLIAVRVSGRRAAPAAALVAAAMLSSAAIGSVFTPAELVAVVPSAASVLCLVAGIQEPGRRGGWLMAGAGALAVVALLVKQSFGDALVAGVVALAAIAVLRELPRRELLARAGAWLAGAGVVVAALLVWEPAAHSRVQSVSYALFGFRLDAVHALTGPAFGAHLHRLLIPSLGSGLVAAVALAFAGLAGSGASRAVRIALAGWLVAGLAGILLGGSYWAHYLIELVPVASVGTAAAFVRWPRAGTLAAAAVALVAVVVTAQAVRIRQPAHYQSDAVAVGHYVRARAEPGSTLYVQYARTNVLYYAGLPDPYPFNWSLMMQAVPGVQRRLQAMLASPRRPTFVVQWQPLHSFRLDRGGATTRLLARYYRPLAHVCGHRILLERGAQALPPPRRQSCATVAS